jgi:pimeloyl-ACP methyl ester carboxylesterase
LGKEKFRKLREKYDLETGFFENGLPYARVGNKDNILINIEALSMKHEPPSGFILKDFIKLVEPFLTDYSAYFVGRKPDLSEDYFMPEMARDYGEMIQNEFQKPVTVMGLSTGGQIALNLAGDYPELIEKLVIISAAYRISKEGAEIEETSANYFKKGKFGKAIASSLDLIYTPGIKRSLMKFFIGITGNLLLGKVTYPNDYIIEVRADREMNFLGRLNEIEAPSLILSGESDICYDADDVRKTAEGIPNSKLILYEGFGHNLVMAHREQIQNDVLKFIKS